MSVVLRQFATNCFHSWKHFDSCTSHLEMLRHSVNGISSRYLQSELLSAPAFSNWFMQKKVPDFSKIPFVLKSTLDHLNSTAEGDASLCTAAET